MKKGQKNEKVDLWVVGGDSASLEFFSWKTLEKDVLKQPCIILGTVGTVEGIENMKNTNPFSTEN